MEMGSSENKIEEEAGKGEQQRPTNKESDQHEVISEKFGEEGMTPIEESDPNESKVWEEARNGIWGMGERKGEVGDSARNLLRWDLLNEAEMPDLHHTDDPLAELPGGNTFDCDV